MTTAIPAASPGFQSPILLQPEIIDCNILSSPEFAEILSQYRDEKREHALSMALRLLAMSKPEEICHIPPVLKQFDIGQDCSRYSGPSHHCFFGTCCENQAGSIRRCRERDRHSRFRSLKRCDVSWHPYSPSSLHSRKWPICDTGRTQSQS